MKLKNKISNFLYRLFRTLILKIRVMIPSLYRPGSDPFISGDTFRKLAKFKYETQNKFDPNDVLERDIIFVETNLVEDYFKNIHHKINEKYILITHNSIESLSNKYISFNDNKIIHWFSENLEIKNNENFSPLPLGLENKRYLKNGRTKYFNLDIKKYSVKKQSTVLCSFATQTNKIERQKVYDIAQTLNFCEIKLFKKRDDYIKHLSSYKFNLCPVGAGLDTHRFWESLLVGTIPIVKKNNLIENFANYNIPMLILDEWTDLQSFDVQHLNEVYDKQIQLLYDSDTLLFDFWKKLILEV